MNRRKLSCIIVAMALVTTLTLPGPAYAAPRNHTPGADAWAWFSGLWSRAVAVVVGGEGVLRKEGHGIDPNGGTTGQSNAGLGMDPDGSTTGALDPNG